jgi:predicted ATPase
MQIRHVLFKNVRNFESFDQSFADSWSGRIADSLLLIGPNGSGKTTLLNVIADLWRVWEMCLLREDESPLTHESLLGGMTLARADLAAIEIVGLDSAPVWICAGKEKICQEFALDHVDSHKLGVVHYDDHDGYESHWYAAPGVAEFGIASPFSGWENGWVKRLTENLFIKQQDLPNVVYLQSENRFLPAIDEKFSVQPEPEEFRWLARYEPATSRKGSLQNYLYNLKVVRESVFEKIIAEANTFLIGKRLDGFDPRTGDLMVEIDKRGQHPISDLSSGEKQVLLMLATITRWLRPGGIVLIDEPDLHLHSSLTTAFVGHLRRMVAAQNGQLLIASHAPELLQDFTTSHRIELGRLSEITR